MRKRKQKKMRLSVMLTVLNGNIHVLSGKTLRVTWLKSFMLCVFYVFKYTYQQKLLQSLQAEVYFSYRSAGGQIGILANRW